MRLECRGYRILLVLACLVMSACGLTAVFSVYAERYDLAGIFGLVTVIAACQAFYFIGYLQGLKHMPLEEKEET